MRPTFWISLIIAAGLALGNIRMAAAHAELVSASPAAGETLAASPAVIELVFDNELAAPGSEFQVSDSNQRVLTALTGSVDLTDPAHQRLRAAGFPALPAGVYTVRWTALSTDGDGARTNGEFSFAVGDVVLPASGGAAAVSAAEAPGAAAPAAESLPPADASASSLWIPGLVVAGIAVVLALMGLALWRDQARAR